MTSTLSAFGHDMGIYIKGKHQNSMSVRAAAVASGTMLLDAKERIPQNESSDEEILERRQRNESECSHRLMGDL